MWKTISIIDQQKSQSMFGPDRFDMIQLVDQKNEELSEVDGLGVMVSPYTRYEQQGQESPTIVRIWNTQAAAEEFAQYCQTVCNFLVSTTVEPADQSEIDKLPS
jgi:hypothetical protein